jgi:anti-sigma-28 factor FlgM
MSDQRDLRIMSLKERIDRDRYRVDVDKVAEAILGRPVVRMLIVPGEMVRVGDDAEPVAEEGGDPPQPSEDVLEAA